MVAVFVAVVVGMVVVVVIAMVGWFDLVGFLGEGVGVDAAAEEVEGD